jgi:hypothetical protein
MNADSNPASVSVINLVLVNAVCEIIIICTLEQFESRMQFSQERRKAKNPGEASMKTVEQF